MTAARLPLIGEAHRRPLADLLDATEKFIRRYVVIDEMRATVTVLWVAHTWVVEAAYSTPYLHLSSAEPESGKTRLLEVLRELVREPLSTMNISDAALFRVIDAKQPTLLFDEVDSIFSEKARERGVREDLRSLLNSGYRRGERVYRMGGGNHTVLESFATFCPKALAGLGNLPPTLQSRAIRLEMKRRRLNEPVEDFFPEDVANEAEHLRGQLEGWAELAVPELRSLRPLRLEGLRDRANEVWRPLLAIAELAGPAWAARARRAALAFSAGGDEDPSLGLLLLADIRTVFEEPEAERIATTELIVQLGRFEESPWGEWWLDPKTEQPSKSGPRRLAQLLRPYGIHPVAVRLGGATPRGYRHEDFFDAWERFLPPRDDECTRNSTTTRTDTWVAAQQEAPENPECCGPPNDANRPEDSDVADVADIACGRHGAGPSCGHGHQWRARDGMWRCSSCEPAAFASEIMEQTSA